MQKHARVAQAAQNMHGVPASILLASAILDSNSGTSLLAKVYNNHFNSLCTHIVHGSECVEYDGRRYYRYNSIYYTYDYQAKYLSIRWMPTRDVEIWAERLGKKYDMMRIINRYNLRSFDR